MPGSWEFSPPEVLVAILTRGTVPTAWSKGYRNLRIPGGQEPVWLAGMPFDHARNVACHRTLEHNFKWLFFLDDDVIPPPDAIERLVARQIDIVSGLYFRRNEPIMPVMLREGSPKPAFVTDYKLGEIVEVDLVGAGCLLIHNRVLRTMGKNWFEWLLDRDDVPEGERCSEDFAFCRKAKKLGFRIYCDTGIQCEHAGHGASSPQRGFVPLEA